jgi:hypothetical protein
MELASEYTMPALKFTIKGVEFEYIGEEAEIMSFINRFLGVSTTAPIQKTLNVRKPHRSIEHEPAIDLPLPSDEEVMNYILSKKDYIHDSREVQQHFFGQTFMSRGKWQRMYYKTTVQLRTVRETIEKQQKGKFEERPSGERNLKRFVFKKANPSEIPAS